MSSQSLANLSMPVVMDVPVRKGVGAWELLSVQNTGGTKIEPIIH